MKISKLTSRGDTIIEVLVALAIVGAVLAGAYAVASRSLRNARDAQERGEALKLAESQIEKLKYMAADYNDSGKPPAKNIFDSFQPFCISTTSANPSITKITTAINTDLFQDNLNVYPAECKSGFYNIAIRYVTGGSSSDNFTVTIHWDRLGEGRDEIVIPYRLHQ